MIEKYDLNTWKNYEFYLLDFLNFLDDEFRNEHEKGRSIDIFLNDNSTFKKFINLLIKFNNRILYSIEFLIPTYYLNKLLILFITYSYQFVETSLNSNLNNKYFYFLFNIDSFYKWIFKDDNHMSFCNERIYLKDIYCLWLKVISDLLTKRENRFSTLKENINFYNLERCLLKLQRQLSKNDAILSKDVIFENYFELTYNYKNGYKTDEKFIDIISFKNIFECDTYKDFMETSTIIKKLLEKVYISNIFFEIKENILHDILCYNDTIKSTILDILLQLTEKKIWKYIHMDDDFFKILQKVILYENDDNVTHQLKLLMKHSYFSFMDNIILDNITNELVTTTSDYDIIVEDSIGSLIDLLMNLIIFISFFRSK